ncbi:RagB/SusD family nutrient uptake outer membrane protein [Carboxylicivirga sp. A043]|uniref:RagB/SusD family nutrient uptake outer membrane protein n=1 Tax=Carboxylicivirga litoralis TaxID=2816963 RepID=UPI0021CB662B|nr:RagB/SusD family nutrient uptake outer membrane protein [Carboxylicivirga sp. A043]MCU4155868.1 RagB/SusD family nutrient uptake outer membrane protein [Carboxylicivirga sp. A043]
MKTIYKFIIVANVIFALVMVSSCSDKLDELPLNTSFTEDVDYTISENMILPLKGAYEAVYTRGWEEFPLISVRGDDVNHGGLGDQQDYAETDKYNYNKDFWMYNSLWQVSYNDIFMCHSAMEQIEKYQEFASNPALGDQYIAEAKVLRAFLLFQVTRVWGDVFIPTNSVPTDLVGVMPTTKDEMMQHLSDQMDEAIPYLLDIHPNKRSDIRGGVTKYTALAIQALANLELKNYQGVADATSEIINSGEFKLSGDFYNLFKIPGKLDDENIFEYQYSDFGQASGDRTSYLFAFFGPQGAFYNPKVEGAGGGWGFYEPSIKWIKFMLDRGETTRLQTSVLFTPRGIAEIQKDAAYATLPEWISNVTPSGDEVLDYPRAMFSSGKHYLPSDQLIPGRNDYGSNNNFRCIRYAEVLLMHAEALTRGASSSVMTADEAVNEVRGRAGLTDLSGVTSEQVMDEKFAELAMEWGTRFYDMVRLGNYAELSYEGRTFTEDKIYLPYPQNQVDQLPVLKDYQR